MSAEQAFRPDSAHPPTQPCVVCGESAVREPWMDDDFPALCSMACVARYWNEP